MEPLGVLDRPGEKPAELVLPMRFPSFDKMRNGEYSIAVGIVINYITQDFR
jgi:hypothetical protein